MNEAPNTIAEARDAYLHGNYPSSDEIAAGWIACLDACVRMVRERADQLEQSPAKNAAEDNLDVNELRRMAYELQQKLGAKP